jgi:transcriptional regulator
MSILQTLSRGSNHGYGIAQHIQQVSHDALKIGEGSLYPAALQRLLMNDYVVAEWGLSENNRRARFYKITAAGRRQPAQERRSFDAPLMGIARVIEAP